MNLRAIADTRLVRSPKYRSKILRLGYNFISSVKSSKSLTGIDPRALPNDWTAGFLSHYSGQLHKTTR